VSPGTRALTGRIERLWAEVPRLLREFVAADLADVVTSELLVEVLEDGDVVTAIATWHLAGAPSLCLYAVDVDDFTSWATEHDGLGAYLPIKIVRVARLSVRSGPDAARLTALVARFMARVADAGLNLPVAPAGDDELPF
jgi:hypothetical protein